MIVDLFELADRLGAGERLIGIDLGTKTIGLALSDVSCIIASPLETIKRAKFTADATALLATARELAGDDPAARAAVAVAEAGVLADVFGGIQTGPDTDVPNTLASAERAVDLAERTGDPLAESVALDAFTAAQSWAGDTFGTAATAPVLRRR